MIRTTLKVGEQLRSVDNLPPPERDPQVLWLEVNAPTAEEAAACVSGLESIRALKWAMLSKRMISSICARS